MLHHGMKVTSITMRYGNMQSGKAKTDGIFPSMAAHLSGITPTEPLRFRALDGAVVDLWHATAKADAFGRYRSPNPRVVIFLNGPVDGMEVITPRMRQQGANVLYIPAGMPSELLLPKAAQLCHIDLHFSAAALQRRMDALGLKVSGRETVQRGSTQVATIAKLLADAIAGQDTHTAALDGLVMATLGQIFPQSESASDTLTQPTGHSCLTARQMSAIRACALSDMSSATTVADLAAAANLSPSWFAHAFKKDFGQSPLRWLMDLRLDAAMVLLQGRNRMTLADIAAATGFSDQAHLTRNFKARHGMPPAEWCRKNLADGHFTTA